jgi:hypothetical protein
MAQYLNLTSFASQICQYSEYHLSGGKIIISECTQYPNTVLSILIQIQIYENIDKLVFQDYFDRVIPILF